MIKFSSGTASQPSASVAQVPVPTAALPAGPAGVPGLSSLPPELWLLCGKYLPALDQARFFGAHPRHDLAREAHWAAMTAAIRATDQPAVVGNLLSQAPGMPPGERARLVVQVVRWAGKQLHRCPCGPAELPLQALLETCLDQAVDLPPRLGNRVLATLLLRLPHPYCDRRDFVPSRHGVFATRLVTGLLAAARDGDGLVCRAVAAAERGLPRLIDLEWGVAPGLGFNAERAARAAEFMQVLARPEVVARGEVGTALATASSLVSYFFPAGIESHLPLLRQLVRTNGTTSNCLGLQYLAEIVDRVADAATRAEVMCEMVASMKAGAQKEGPQAVHDGVGVMARVLRRPTETLDPVDRASVNAALKTAGYQGAAL